MAYPAGLSSGVALGARAKLAGGAAHQRARSHGLARGVAASLDQRDPSLVDVAAARVAATPSHV
jgi:hypothetical protein